MRKALIFVTILLATQFSFAETYICQSEKYEVKTYPWNPGSDFVIVLTNKNSNEVSNVPFSRTVVEDMIELVYIGTPTTGSIKSLVLNIDNEVLSINGKNKSVSCTKGDQTIF